ncbi:MAG TPA: hypothetical protein H9935_10010 [Candidatus Blautia merdigallinarum]|uniref:Uncharacterized protein n=1 Tax=Candidatus Blautia merdigallinarum TaxID=2838495 RepID=A0A9D2SK87_9FIRM|nr:hypothetical protein [Candidatus Blautia merdigallinarum]
MERLIFYWGACLMGLFCLISMLAVYNSNKRVLKDLKQPGEEKDKWLMAFMLEHQKLLKENTRIHNPSVYVVKRMRGRKIGPWSIRQMKNISWGTFILSFLFAGLQILYAWPPQTGLITISFLGRETTVFTFSMVAGICTEVFLLALRMVMGIGYQEDVIETSLLDYVENRWREPAKIIPLENARSSNARVQKKKEKEKDTQASRDSRDKAARQMEQGILEAAATDSRYSHLLNKEEEAIVKDVIKEFLT